MEDVDFSGWHQSPVTIRFADLDMLGHVNNAKYLTYMEFARMLYFSAVVGDEVDWDEDGFILAKAEVNFRVPVELDDASVIVFTNCTRTGSKSFDLSYVVTKKDSKTICATGVTTLVCYNYKRAESISLPENWRALLEAN